MQALNIHRVMKWSCSGGLILLLYLLPKALFSQDFPQIYIEIKQDSINELETHPFTNEDVHGNFVADSQRIDGVEIHYRGAYYLYTLMQQGNYRNWKIKTSKINRYRQRREWNFNYDLQVRQRLAYLLMREAGVPCVSAQHVVLHVNGKRQGIYLQYEDPDNKAWLTETFGDNDGDLYKAAYDMPNETKYFADLTYLGEKDSDYFLHYRKQTNNNDEDEFDYSSIRNFTYLINHTPDDQFDEAIRQNFDVETFLKYLVVSNFMAHWDGYPFRPKNYFLYQNPVDHKWNFIPWDMDATFQSSGHFNSIGNSGSVFHYFDGYEPYNKVDGEPTERPLVWNLMKHSGTRNQYISAYKTALQSYLSEDFLNNVLDSLWLDLRDNSTRYERVKFHDDIDAVKSFIAIRHDNVMDELSNFSVETGLDYSGKPLKISGVMVYPNPSNGPVQIVYNSANEKSRISIYSTMGQIMFQQDVHGYAVNRQLEIENLESGMYVLVVSSGKEKHRTLINLEK